MPRFLLVLDTPGIKSFVFGTDSLAEVRGASALLDRLNRKDTESELHKELGRPNVYTVFCNGGTGQFLIEAADRDRCEQATECLSRYYRQETGGEARVVWGLSEWAQGRSYRDTLDEAHFQMRLVREAASAQRVAGMVPFFKECESASHLSATALRSWGDERLLLSDASWLKRRESTEKGFEGPWADWMEHLASKGAWPRNPDVWAGKLRCSDTSSLPEQVENPRGQRQGYLALVYADGNSMGQLVQALPDADTFREFSRLVDGSIRLACHAALDHVTAPEIERVRRSPDQPRPLPADILLLGGDDLMVLLPAQRALPFALEATKQFEQATREAIHALPAAPRAFFDRELKDQPLTISCGVALAPSAYPFYLLEDLAEDLLKSAKKGGSADPEVRRKRKEGRKIVPGPSYIDFHLVTGAASHDLVAVREEDYGVRTPHARTLRPCSRATLGKLQEAVQALRGGDVRLPRSKQHDLIDSALEPRPAKAQRLVREVFSRCKPRQREGLRRALLALGALDPFPWSPPDADGRRATALVDLIEAIDLFPPEQ